MSDRAVVIAWLASFLLGSIPFGLIVARIFHVGDLRSRGSGNIGATNVARVVGFWPAGFVTFMLDLVKGAAPVLVMQQLAGQYSFSMMDIWGAALLAVLGHCYSPWLRLQGGKGVATGFGVVLVLSPLAALIGLVAFACTFCSTRTGSLSSLSGLIAASAAYLVWQPLGAHLWVGATLILVILVRHEGNIDALLENREAAFRH